MYARPDELTTSTTKQCENHCIIARSRPRIATSYKALCCLSAHSPAFTAVFFTSTLSEVSQEADWPYLFTLCPLGAERKAQYL